MMAQTLSVKEALKFWSGSYRHLECDSDEDIISPKFRKIGSTRFPQTPLASLDFLVPAEVRMKNSSRSVQNTLSFSRGRGAEMSSRKASKENISIQDDDECIVVSDEENEWVPASPIPKNVGRLKLMQKSTQAKMSRNKNSTVEANKDDEIEILKTVKSKEDHSLHFSTPKEGISSVNKRFFLAARKDPSLQFQHPHAPKVKETNLVSSKPKRNSALDESIRLDEKMQYSQLLKQQCSAFPFFYGSHSERKKLEDQMMGGDISKNKSVVDVIDLTDDSAEPAKTTKNKQTAVNRKDSDNELEIIEMKTSTPQREGYRKLFDPLKKQFFCSNWIFEESELFDSAFRERQKRADQQRIKAELCHKNNKKLYADILEERIRNHMKITEAILEDEVLIEEPEEVVVLPKLTPEIERRVAAALRPEPQSEVLVEAFSLRITRHDICTLAGMNWLNDEVINFYMNLLIERGKKDKYPLVYAFNTFFYPRLQSSGYIALKRWTRKVDVFAHEIIIIPVHLGVHWCMAAINFKKKTVSYYDSMGSNNDVCLQLLWNYLNSECMDKKKQKFNYDGWKTENVKKIPQQMNGSDCGVFSCTYAEFICRNARFGFSQKDMPYFRRKMVYEILTKGLMM